MTNRSTTRNVVDIAIEEINALDGVLKIVSRSPPGREQPTRGIELVVVLADSTRIFGLTTEGFPIGYRERLEEICRILGEGLNKPVQPSMEWIADYERTVSAYPSQVILFEAKGKWTELL